MNHSEITIQCTETCKNSPKKEVLKELTIALVKNELETFLRFVTADLIWNIVGHQEIHGIENVKKSFIKYENMSKLQIHHIITHGNKGTVNGTLICKEQTIHFCHVYYFNNHSKTTKVKAITSYIITE